MKNYTKKLIEAIEDYSADEELSYEVNNGFIRCYYKGSPFVNFDDSGWMYPVNLSQDANLNDIKNSDSAYKLFYISELMLRVVGILNK